MVIICPFSTKVLKKNYIIPLMAWMIFSLYVNLNIYKMALGCFCLLVLVYSLHTDFLALLVPEFCWTNDLTDYKMSSNSNCWTDL